MENKDKRVAIINSTVSVVAEHGFHEALMRMIADRAGGIGSGTIYIFFESKDYLMQETYRELEQRCLAAVMKEYPFQGSIRQRFYHLIHELMHHYMLFPTEFLFVDQFLSSPYRKSAIPNDMYVEELSKILQLFREGMEKQIFKEMPPAMLFVLACGPAIQVLRANMAGILFLNNDRISGTVKACWEAVSLQKISRGQSLPKA